MLTLQLVGILDEVVQLTVSVRVLRIEEVAGTDGVEVSVAR